jgi:hypothetical protein
MHFDLLEGRTLLAAAGVLADLLVDSDRDGQITIADNIREYLYSDGKGGRGAIVLPNFDRDNTNTAAPDNWAGGSWNGRPAAPNNVIDNAADLLDVGKLRLAKLNVDDAYNYRVTLQILRPGDDPAAFRTVAAEQRVRVFFPTRQLEGGVVVAQEGDVAAMGPGIGDTIRFVNNPAGPNEYPISDIAGPGYLEFGVEGLKAGAQVRVKVTVEYDPVLTDSSPVGGPIDGPVDDPGSERPPEVDKVMLRVAPFVLQDNRQAVTRVLVENMNRYGLDNAEARDALREVFGDQLIESHTGDIWQQDGYEIGYVKAPYGQMPVILELPRGRDVYFDQTANIRSFVRGTLLAAGVGVNTDLAGKPTISGSSYGGDIESLPRPGAAAGAPGYLVASGMPAYMKDYFAAQGVNPLLDVKLDDWLGVAHVDEVVHLSPGGEQVLIADPEVAWALALWAVKLDPDVRVHPKMNSNESLPGYTEEGMKLALFMENARFREQNLEYAAGKLRGVYGAVRRAMGLSGEVSTPGGRSKNSGGGALARGGAFASMLGEVRRTFEVRFVDAEQYQLRFRDGGGSASKWFDGSRSRDEVFPEAKAFLLRHYFEGEFAAGDRFTFHTNPEATLIKAPVLFQTSGLFFEDPAFPTPQPWRMGAFTSNSLNSLSDGQRVVTGKAFGPKVNWNGQGGGDLFEAYTAATFRKAGYTSITFTDARLYHDSGGGLHCGTNALRAIPQADWWA